MNTTPPVKEFILCAAIHYNDGKVYEQQQCKNITEGFVVAGRRHHNCINTFSILAGMGNYDVKLVSRNAQGFITNLDRFVSRSEGYHIAKAASQLLHNMHDTNNPILISEDLYSEDLY